MKLFLKICFYLIGLFLVLIYVKTVSGFSSESYTSIIVLFFLTLILTLLLFIYFLRLCGKSYKVLGVVLSLLPCITIILNCFPHTTVDTLDALPNEITYITVYPIVKQGIEFYSLNTLVLLIGLIIYIYQVRTKR